MKNENRNIRVMARSGGANGGFHIYLSFSGQQEYLMSHRRNSDLFELLNREPALSDLRRLKAHSGKGGRRGLKMENGLGHIINAIDDYMEYRFQAA